MRDYDGVAKSLKRALEQGDDVFVATVQHNKQCIIHALECAAMVTQEAKTLQFEQE